MFAIDVCNSFIWHSLHNAKSTMQNSFLSSITVLCTTFQQSSKLFKAWYPSQCLSSSLAQFKSFISI